MKDRFPDRYEEGNSLLYGWPGDSRGITEYAPDARKICFREGRKNIAAEKMPYAESRLHKLTFYILDGEIIPYTMYLSIP